VVYNKGLKTKIKPRDNVTVKGLYCARPVAIV